MKKIKLLSLLCGSLVILMYLSALPVHAAIFASDAVYLFNGGKRIADNSIIVLYMQDGKEHMDVCEKGLFWLRQGPTWKAGPYTFIQTSHKDILNLEKWLATPEGKASRYQSNDYQDYLRKKTAGAPVSTEIKIPTVKESPALDRTPSVPPRPDMAEGKLGYDRFFLVDLDTGTVTQTHRSEIFKGSGN